MICETLPEVCEELPMGDAHVAAPGGHSWPQGAAELEAGMGMEKLPKAHLSKPTSYADCFWIKTGFHSFHSNKITTHGFFSDEFLLLSDFSLLMNYCQTITPPLLPRKYSHLFSPCYLCC